MFSFRKETLRSIIQPKRKKYRKHMCSKTLYELLADIHSYLWIYLNYFCATKINFLLLLSFFMTQCYHWNHSHLEGLSRDFPRQKSRYPKMPNRGIFFLNFRDIPKIKKKVFALMLLSARRSGFFLLKNSSFCNKSSVNIRWYLSRIIECEFFAFILI